MQKRGTIMMHKIESTLPTPYKTLVSTPSNLVVGRDAAFILLTLEWI